MWPFSFVLQLVEMVPPVRLPVHTRPSLIFVRLALLNFRSSPILLVPAVSDGKRETPLTSLFLPRDLFHPGSLPLLSLDGLYLSSFPRTGQDSCPDHFSAGGLVLGDVKRLEGLGEGQRWVGHDEP